MSTVNGIWNMPSTETPEVKGNVNQLTQEDFLKVLVAQYSNQIPTDAASSTEFYKNLMDLSNYTAIQQVGTDITRDMAQNIVGKNATAKDEDTGVSTTGKVTAATFDGTDWLFTINGAQYKMKEITGIVAETTTSGT